MMLLVNFLKSELNLFFLYNEVISDSLGVVPDKLRIGEEVYFLDEQSKDNLGFTGFFDWLRSDEENIVGVRFNYFEHHGYNNLLSLLPYVHNSDRNEETVISVEFLFEGNDYRLDISGDQDFTDNFFYTSANNNYICTINTDFLTEIELKGVLKKSIQIGNIDVFM